MVKSDKKEILLCKKMIRVLKKGYGKKRCKTWDWEDFHELKKRGSNGRCPSCEAHEVIMWLEKHVKMMQM